MTRLSKLFLTTKKCLYGSWPRQRPMYEIYISRAAEIFGVPKAREIYEQAIESGLPDKDAKTMCMKYAELEKNLGEIDRARGIYRYAANFADPRVDEAFWKKWNDFEVQHGNEETFREMLRVKRSMLASFSQTHFILPENLMMNEKLNNEEDGTKNTEDEMAALERQLVPDSQPAGETGRRVSFISAGVESQPGVVRTPDGGRKVTANQEDIDLPDENDSDDESADKVEIAQKAVPASVFGELAPLAEDVNARNAASEDSRGESHLGALERIKRQRQQ